MCSMQYQSLLVLLDPPDGIFQSKVESTSATDQRYRDDLWLLTKLLTHLEQCVPTGGNRTPGGKR
jgi:hypothetical protein